MAERYGKFFYRSSLLSGNAEIKVSVDGQETVIFPKSVCSGKNLGGTAENLRLRPFL